MEEGSVALLAELLEVLRASAAHCLHHLATQLHWRGQRLRVTPQNVAKVNVEQRPRCCQQQVVQVTVSHS